MNTSVNHELSQARISFEDLFNLEDVQRLQDEFSGATGVASIITHPDGTPLTVPSNFTCLCSQIIRKTPKGCANCFKSDAALGRYHPEGPIVQPCLSGGLWDAGAAITVGGHHIANWLIGQVRDELQTDENMRAYAREIGADESAFIKAFQAVPSMSRQQFERIAKMLFTFASQLSASAYQNLQQRRLIAELRRAEEALRLKNLAFDSSLAANSIAGLDGALTEVNDMFLRLWGYCRKDEVMGKPMRSFFSEPLEVDTVFAILRKQGQWEGTFTAQRRDRSEFLAHGLATDVRDDDGQVIGFQSSIMDVTDRLRVQAELQKMQRLTSVGTLAGGIAHDFNNIMMGLFGNIALAKNEFPKDHEGYKALEEAEKSMGRAIRLTKQLLTFAKGGEPVKESISLGALVEEVAKFDLAGSNVRLEYKQAADLWMVKADKGQVQQVISNLTINAREAMPDGGHLFITLENADLQEAAIPALPPGKYIKVTVRDEGTGIDPKMVERIFDPYFSTKQTGSGLGLATVYSIISKHGGYIGVESELGKGATFSLFFPASEIQQVALDEKSGGAHVRLTSATRILLMDDEDVIRMVIPRWLKKVGCAVTTVSEGSQAVDLYRQALNEGHPFDVVILDLTIPGGLGGVEVAKVILALNPDARLIASSGYAEGAVMSNFTAYGFKGVIAKPYTESQLCDVLESILA